MIQGGQILKRAWGKTIMPKHQLMENEQVFYDQGHSVRGERTRVSLLIGKDQALRYLKRTYGRGKSREEEERRRAAPRIFSVLIMISRRALKRFTMTRGLQVRGMVQISFF